MKANTALALSLGIDTYRSLPDDARQIMLSDGRSVWVDADDPNSDEDFRKALEAN